MLRRPHWGAAVLPLAVALLGATLATGPVLALDPPPTTIGSIDVDTATIPELHAAMDAGELSSEQLVQRYLDRIEVLDPQLNAIIALNPAALDEARAADAARAEGAALPLLGIPVLLKDNIATTGMPTTAGSLALAGSEPPDAFIVTRLRDAGAVILGKANLSEWAYMRGYPASSGWSAVGGQANNPYALDRNPCGSSSGSAVAVAASLVTVAVGTETDGSILCPSSATGIVGVKPSLGLVSRSGIVPISLQQDTAGPMARSVTDAAILLGVLVGEDPDDPMGPEASGRGIDDYTSALDADALQGARIGVWREGLFGVDPRVDAVMESAIVRLEELGAEVVDPVALELEGLGDNEFAALLTEFKHDIGAYLETLEADTPQSLQGLIDFNLANADEELAIFGQEVFEWAQESADITDPEYLEARRTAVETARNALDSAMAEHDLDAIVAPSGDIAWVTSLDPDEGIFSWAPAAVAGYPSISVPAGHVSGLPVGISFMGPRFGEAEVLGLAYAWEQANPVRVPPTFPESVEVEEPAPADADADAEGDEPAAEDEGS
jgi:amidase